jgi:uncharacterized protein (DUF4415 family)
MGRVVRKTPEEIKAMRERGEIRTDRERVRTFSVDEIERMAAEDPDNPFISDEDWSRAIVTRHRGPQKAPTKRPVALRLSPDVLDYFRATGKGWQGKIDDILREWVRTHKAD